MDKIMTIVPKKNVPTMKQVLEEEKKLFNLRVISNAGTCPLNKEGVTRTPFGRKMTCNLGSNEKCEHKSKTGGAFCEFGNKAFAENRME